MSWSKGEIVASAWRRAAGLLYDEITPEDMADGLEHLNLMMAMWDGNGVRLGYNISSSPSGGELDDPSGLPDVAIYAVRDNLAIDLSIFRGIEVSPEFTIAAAKAYSAVLKHSRRVACAPPLPSTLPMGAGRRRYGNYRKFPAPEQETLSTGPGELPIGT